MLQTKYEKTNKIILFVLTALAVALCHFVATLCLFVFAAQGDTYTATIIFFVYTFFILIIDRLEKLIYTKLLLRKKENRLSLFLKFSLKTLDGPSNKTAVYFLYIAILAWTAISSGNLFQIGTEADSLVTLLKDYSYSMRYSILVLMAGDKFFENLFKDIKAIKKIETECEG